MKKQIADRWVAALKSGEYSQTKECLRDEYGFCCLGVLCDLYSEGEWKEEYGDEDAEFAYTFQGEGSELPSSVMSWSGMKTDLGRFNDTHLAAENDSGKTFAEIADIIETHWEAL